MMQSLAKALVVVALITAWVLRYEDLGMVTIPSSISPVHMHRNRITGAVCDVIEECWVERSTARLLSTKADDQPSPASTDIWSRRGQCIEIGKNKLKKTVKEAHKDWKISVRVRYAPDIGRCYVMIGMDADSEGVPFTVNQTDLYDGQTDEQLAHASIITPRDGRPVEYSSLINECCDHLHLRKYGQDMQEYRHEEYTATVEYIKDRIRENQK
jgi:hypothetical protein